MTNHRTELDLAITLAFREPLRVLLAMVLAAMVPACGSTSTTTTALGPTPVKCSVSVTASPSAMDAAGGAGSVAVATQPECTWTASAEANWISGLSPTSGQGSAAVAFQAAPNPDGIARQGGVTVNGQQAAVSQAAAACGFDLGASSVQIPAAGSTVTVSVGAPNGCSWQASSSSAWISVIAGNSGTGSGTVTVRVVSNTGIARTGSVVIGGQTLTVAQAAAAPVPGTSSCEFSIQPTTASIPAAGGTRTAVVAARAGCAWNATSSAPWVTITAGASGDGGGSVTFSVAANTGSARTAALSIADETLSISQAGNCSVSINPTSQSVGASGGTGTSIAVSSAAGCSWTASSTVPWLAIVSGASGSGNGSVTFSVAANTDTARVSSLSIGNQTFTVNQAATTCSFSIDPSNQSVGASGATGTQVSVSTTPGCAWTASSNAPWISITSGPSGNGAGSVTFSIAANTGTARNGTLTIAGQTFTVTQAAAATCAFSINPTSQSVGSAGGAGTQVGVSTSSGCAWTATSNTPWITVASGAGGTGSGNVSFSVAANTGAARTGTLTIAGQTFTVTQAASCTYSISPTSQSVAAGGGAGSSITVSTGAGCTWTAASNVSWIAIASGGSGSGNGSVTFTVSANTGSARTGTLTVAGQTFTVTQAANCSYSISPSSMSPPEAGGVGTSSVSAPSACAWTATSNASWITVLTGASGSGNGTVTFQVAANKDKRPRDGTLTIAGQTFIVSQDGH